MPHIHMLNNGPMRRGATVYPGEGVPPSGFFHESTQAKQQTAPDSASIDGVGLHDGLYAARPVASGDFSLGSGSAASVVLPAPGVGRSHAIHSVSFAYGSAPTGGQLTITDGVSTYQVPVTAAGPGPISFKPPMVFAPNAAVSGSLSGGGSGVFGSFGFTGRAIV